MDDHLDTTIKELCAIDSTLREREEDLRSLLTVLLAEKPAVDIDQEFLRTLRSRLILGTEPTPATTNTPTLSTYFFRFAPLAAMAILLLVLVSPTRPTTTPPTTDSLSLPTQKGVATPGEYARTGPVVSEDVSTFSMITPELPEAAPTVDSFAVNNQGPGNTVQVTSVSLAAPSFFLVHEADENNGERFGALLGVSNLIPAGSLDSITITLTKPTQSGASSVYNAYTVTLFRDNGDGIFSLATDAPVLDPASVEPDYFPLRIFFKVGAQY